MKTNIFIDKEMLNMQTSNAITIGNKGVGSKTEAKPKTRNAIVSQRCACNDAEFLRVERKSFSRTIQSNLYEVSSFCDIGDR